MTHRDPRKGTGEGKGNVWCSFFSEAIASRVEAVAIEEMSGNSVGGEVLRDGCLTQQKPSIPRGPLLTMFGATRTGRIHLSWFGGVDQGFSPFSVGFRAIQCSIPKLGSSQSSRAKK